MKKTVKALLYIPILMYLVFPAYSFAARVYLDPIIKEVSYGDTFIVNIRIDNEGECVNAADVVIEYDKNRISAVDFSRGESLLTLWTESPVIDHTQGVVSFSGGTPGGYCGRIVGDPGLSNLLGKIVFSTTGNQVSSNPGDITEIVVSGTSTKILLNDGLGTPAELETSGAFITLLEEADFVTNEWVDEISQDELPPEPFDVRVHSDPNIENGQYFIVFTTVDKQSGIDHFEVFESSIDTPGYEVGSTKPAQWRTVSNNEQYYVLRDQTLSSKVIVKAVDKANNEQIAELNTQDVSSIRTFGLIETAFIATTAVGLLILLLGIIMFFRRKKRGSHHEFEPEHNHINEI